MMEQFARSLQNSSQMVNLIKFDKKEIVGEEIRYPTRDAIANATAGFSPETIVASRKDAVGCKEYDGLYKTLFKIKYGVDWKEGVEKAETDLSKHEPKTNLRKYARGLYRAAQFLSPKPDGKSSEYKKPGCQLINKAITLNSNACWSPDMKEVLSSFMPTRMTTE